MWRRRYPAASRLTVLLSLSLCAVQNSAAQNSAATIIQRSAEANERDWLAAPKFDNSVRDRNKDGDKTYAVTMLYGSPYERVIAANNQPVNSAKQKEEQNKFAKEENRR